jgi:hypothetical protein
MKYFAPRPCHHVQDLLLDGVREYGNVDPVEILGPDRAKTRSQFGSNRPEDPARFAVQLGNPLVGQGPLQGSFDVGPDFWWQVQVRGRNGLIVRVASLLFETADGIPDDPPVVQRQLLQEEVQAGVRSFWKTGRGLLQGALPPLPSGQRCRRQVLQELWRRISFVEIPSSDVLVKVGQEW